MAVKEGNQKEGNLLRNEENISVEQIVNQIVKRKGEENLRKENIRD